MRFVKGLVVAASAAFLLACGGGGPADKMYSIMDKALSAVEANKGDLAKEVQAIVDANKEAFAGAMKELGEMAAKDPEKAKKLQEAMGEKMKAMQERTEKLEKEIPGLKEHEGLKAAMKGLMGGM
jgi:peptidoglycan hydrolase CwlO-like protein